MVKRKEKFQKVLSAGCVVIKKERGQLKVLVSQHSTHKGWSFPKGHVEEGETPAATAHREVAEEVGVEGKILGKAGTTTYFYTQDNVRYFKTVIYFFMKFEREVPAATGWEVSGVRWLPVDEVDDQLTFEDDKRMWDKAVEKISSLEL